MRLRKYELGKAYARGTEVPRNMDEAVTLCRRSAEHGYLTAEDNMGVLLRDGAGVKKNAKEAADWFKKASDAGFRKASLHLAQMYLFRRRGSGKRLQGRTPLCLEGRRGRGSSGGEPGGNALQAGVTGSRTSRNQLNGFRQQPTGEMRKPCLISRAYTWMAPASRRAL